MEKLALVTGGTRGLGRSISLDLAKRGFRVIALYRQNQTAAEALEAHAKNEGLKIQTMAVDLSDAESVRAFLPKLQAQGELKVLVHAASRDFEIAPFSAWTPEKINELWQTNVMGAVNLFQLLFPLLKKADSPLVISVLSSVVKTHSKGFFGYVTVKSALDGMMRALAVEWAKNKIKLVCVYPPAMSTGVYETWPELVQEMIKGGGDLASPEIVAHQIGAIAVSSENAELGKVYELTF